MIKSNMRDIKSIIFEESDNNFLFKKITVLSLKENKKEVFGDDFFSSIEIIGFDGRDLIIKCKNGFWKNEVFLNKYKFIDDINTFLKKDLVKNLIIK